MPKLRYQSPDRLPGATEFSKDAELRGSLNAARLLKSQPWVWDDLRADCELEVKYARKRMKGHWELAAVAFVTSGHVDVEPWYDETTDELWRECGFRGKPSYKTVHRRLRELEKVCDKFLDAAALVIRRCREHDSHVMAHTHYDWTEDETHAGLIHDCQPGEGCTYQQKTGRRPRAPKRLRRTATQEAREVREKLNTEPPDESAEKEKKYLPDDEQTPQSSGEQSKRVRVNGCWYRTRDVEAGIRAYGPAGKTKRFWHGYSGGKAIDHYTGGVIPSVDSASRQECHLFPELYDRVTKMLGEAPETAIGDRGISLSPCFEHATRNGTAPIFPWRAHGATTERQDKESHDRHGVMRCKHCGGPMSQVKFSTAGGEPRLWFRCVDGTETPGCAKEQTISCSTDWRTLIPLARTQPLYHELKQSHKTYEATHDYWRDRYKVCADNLGVRPKAVGLDWHRLRAYVACLVEWLRIAKKNNWLSEPHEHTPKPAGKRCFKQKGKDAASDLNKARTHLGLAEPYGPKAAKLGIGRATLPSERHPSKRKNQIALDLPGP